MKHRFIPLVMVLALCASIATPAPARQTNETKQAKSEKKVFFFPGGYPHDFILAMDKHFRTRLMEILSIPSTLAKGEVPKMRVATEDPGEVLGLYNRLDDPMLGKWYYQPNVTPQGTNLNVLTLIPDKSAVSGKPERGSKVKALALGGVNKSKWKALEEDVNVARELGINMAERLGGEKYDGTIFIQPESKILIASGSEGFIEMVESVVAAHRENAELESKLK